MSPKLTADEIVTQKHLRYFYQPGGAGPSNRVFYAGQDGQYMIIEDASNPKSGGISPINVQDLSTPGKYRRVGRTIDPADFPSATVQFMQKHHAVPRHLIGFDCPITFYQHSGACEDLSDAINGWSDYIKIFSSGEQTEASEKGGAFDSDEGLMDGLDFVFDVIYPIGKLQFGEELESGVTREVVDLVYGSKISCGACGPSDDGTRALYALVKENSGVAAGFVAYRIGTTAGTSAITGAANSDLLKGIDIVGKYLVVLFDDGAGGGYFAAEINPLTGAPGTWSKIDTGFVTGGEPTDIFVASPREVWISGKGGYIYKATSLLQGVDVMDAADTTTDDLLRIHGVENVIVAAGETGRVVYSLNRGETFAATTATPAASNIQGLRVRNELEFWAGTVGGEIYVTADRGETWTEINMPAGATIATVQDIVFPTDEVGYVLAATAGPAGLLYATWDGGKTWCSSTPRSGRISNYPVIDRGNRASFPQVDNAGIAANYLAIGGLAGDGADGVVLVGAATMI